MNHRPNKRTPQYIDLTVALPDHRKEEWIYLTLAVVFTWALAHFVMVLI